MKIGDEGWVIVGPEGFFLRLEVPQETPDFAWALQGIGQQARLEPRGYRAVRIRIEEVKS